jgi:hypothetical protein
MSETSPQTTMKDSLGYKMLQKIGAHGGSGGITSFGFD